MHQPTTPGNCVPLRASGGDATSNAVFEPGGASTSTLDLEVFALRSPARVIGWVHNRANYWYKLPHRADSNTDPTRRLHNDNQSSTPDSIPALVGQRVTVPRVARPGRYRLEFFSTYPFYARSRGGHGKSADLQQELTELFNSQNTATSPDSTSIPATYLRVTVSC